MLITGPIFLVHPYDPTDCKNGFTVTCEDGTVVAHCTTHESAMAAARLMASGSDFYQEPWEVIRNPFDWEPNFGPVFKVEIQ